ncbi:MAG TPA: hypothetical protein VGB17_17765 [Pyrinomonadaceae bacterium]|jgi:hypothetical protein
MSKTEKESTTTDAEEPSKAELQRRLEETRESISQTVDEIKESVTEQYESVKETVTGVLDYREQFQQEPLVWSIGALSAGFALGYTLGYAHKNTDAHGHAQSQIAAFADSLLDELSTVGKSFIMPTLNFKIKELFGFDFAGLLEEVGETRKGGAKKSAAAKASSSAKGSSKKGSARKQSAKKRAAAKKGRAKKSKAS